MIVPDGLEAIKEMFGDPTLPGFEGACIVPFDLPYPLVYGSAMVHRSRCHRLMVETFQAAFEELRHQGLVERATHYGGIYAHRSVRASKSGRLSTHAWGIAVDINPQENLLGTPGHMDPRVIAVFDKLGFVWGGRFKRCDPMHFQFAKGY